MSTTHTAQLVRHLTGSFTGDAALYKLDPPMKLTKYDYETFEEVADGETALVIVSAATVMFSGPETYIFPATESGEVAGWSELTGSYRGGLSHEEALAGAGYVLATL
jgi:hypothetical protein